MMDEMTTPF